MLTLSYLQHLRLEPMEESNTDQHKPELPPSSIPSPAQVSSGKSADKGKLVDVTPALEPPASQTKKAIDNLHSDLPPGGSPHQDVSSEPRAQCCIADLMEVPPLLGQIFLNRGSPEPSSDIRPSDFDRVFSHLAQVDVSNPRSFWENSTVKTAPLKLPSTVFYNKQLLRQNSVGSLGGIFLQTLATSLTDRQFDIADEDNDDRQIERDDAAGQLFCDGFINDIAGSYSAGSTELTVWITNWRADSYFNFGMDFAQQLARRAINAGADGRFAVARRGSFVAVGITSVSNAPLLNAALRQILRNVSNH